MQLFLLCVVVVVVCLSSAALKKKILLLLLLLPPPPPLSFHLLHGDGDGDERFCEQVYDLKEMLLVMKTKIHYLKWMLRKRLL